MGIKSERGGKAVAAVGLQYFIYFGVLGAFLPYFNLYCFHLGFSGFQIGLLSGFRSVTLVVFALAWAALADRFQNRKAIYLYCSLAAAAAWTLFLASEDFSFLVMATLVYGIFFAPLISFLEAFALDSLDRDKRRYGRLRAWGSISFIATVLILGWVIDLVGSRIILGVILAGSLVQAAGAVALPAMGPKTGKKTPIDRRFLARPRTVVFLACGLLMLASHGTYYGFFSIHLEALGVGKTLIGTAWALASMAEILVMVGSERLFRKFSLESVLTVSFAVAALRWLILARSTLLPAIFLSQALHAVTYGTFHMASILYMDRLTPPEAKTMGQAVNNAVQYGLGMMAGFLLNGWLYEPVGSFGLFAVSAALALAALALFGGFARWGEAIRPLGDVADR